MTVTEHYRAECDSGRDPTSVLQELNSLDCNEDKPYKDACGGSFTSTNIIDACNKVVYRTEAATSTDDFVRAVTLKGSVNFPVNYGLKVFFQISTNPAVDHKGCLLPSSAILTPYQGLSANGALQTVTEIRSNQAAGLYYYQVVVIINCGLDTEEAYCGNVVQYPIGPTKQPTTAPTKSPTTAPTKKPTTSPTNVVTRAPTTTPVCSFFTRNTTVRCIFVLLSAGLMM